VRIVVGCFVQNLRYSCFNLNVDLDYIGLLLDDTSTLFYKQISKTVPIFTFTQHVTSYSVLSCNCFVWHGGTMVAWWHHEHSLCHLCYCCYYYHSTMFTFNK